MTSPRMLGTIKLSFEDWLEAWGLESEDVTIVEMLPFIDEGGEKLFVRATPG
jgi:hypothetical protein